MSPPRFRLRLPPDAIQTWATKYSYASESWLADELAETVKVRGHLYKDDLIALCKWKSPRNQRHAERNSEEIVREVTKFALTTSSEEAKIKSLLVLEGVSWPTASCVLHFFHTQDYPILDFRALWSLNQEVPKAWSFPYWWSYTAYVRRLKVDTGLSMRTIDRALWQYSKAKQNR
jgi:hypothetical protein